MANTNTNVAPLLLRAGLSALRENSIMAQLVNVDFAPNPAEPGTPIRIPIPSAVPAQSVTAGSDNTATALSPTAVNVTLDQWYEAVFELSDKDVGEIMNGFVPSAVSEAVKSLANNVDSALLALYKDIYTFAGAAGTTPDGIDDIANCRKKLNVNLAPMSDRRLVVDPEADAKFLQLDAFVGADKSGSTIALREGSLGRLMGFETFSDQNIGTHTAGTPGINGSDKTGDINGAVSAGATTMALDGLTDASGTIKKGDLFTVAGHTTQYVVTANATMATNAATITFSPAAPTGGFANDAVVTFINSHVYNLAFHRDAFVLATRPLPVDPGLGSLIEAISDPVSGLSLRLEKTRSSKVTRWSFDILYGVATLRPELGCRLLG